MTEAARIEMPEAGYISTLVDILIYIETARYHPVPIADSTAYGVLPKNFKTTALYHQVSRNNRKNNMENKALVGLLAVLPLMTLVRFTHCLFFIFSILQLKPSCLSRGVPVQPSSHYEHARSVPRFHYMSLLRSCLLTSPPRQQLRHQLHQTACPCVQEICPWFLGV